MEVVMASSLPSLLLYQICSKLQVLDFGNLNDELPSLLLAIDFGNLPGQYNQQLDILSSDAHSSRLAACTKWCCNCTQRFTETSRSITSYKLVGLMNFEWTRFFGPIFNWCTWDRLNYFFLSTQLDHRNMARCSSYYYFLKCIGNMGC